MPDTIDVIADRYRLEEVIGAGGTARVYRAVDTVLDVVRAVKVLQLQVGPDGEHMRDRLRSEARAMAGLEHPNILTIYDIGADGPRDYIVMDLLPRGSVADLVAERGPLPVEQAVQYALQALAALEAAHAAGIVHRDVKPGNLLLQDEATVQLCDFGIALKSDTDRKTRTGTALGSLPYMSPEQRMDAHGVTPAADIYSVGCTLYELVTDATPVDLFLAPGMSPRWAEVPEAIRPVVQRATQASPGDRFPDAPSMARALKKAVQEHVGRSRTSERPAPAPEPLTNKLPSTKSAVWIGIALVITIVFVAFVAVDRMEHAGVGPTPAPAAVPEHNPNDVLGMWRGSLDGEADAARLRLNGHPRALSGQMIFHSGGIEVNNAVAGTYDPVSGTLSLKDTGKPPIGTYRATVDPTKWIVDGTYARDGMDPMAFSLIKTSE